ncbi:MAG: hypothetical protein IPL61_04200 [Myxococcales bacterium]|nr:hypothetical protein [Myxococcales bacterium]
MPTSPCPGCGVAVAAGYPRCPKCHAPMPGVAGGRTRRDTNQGGGTTVTARSSRATGVALVVAGAAVLAAVVALVMTSGSAHRKVATDPRVTAVTPMTSSARRIDDTAIEAPPPPPAPPEPWPVLDRLERALAAERLYGKVTIRGGAVEVRSSFCEEARVQALVDGALADLRAVGAATVACVAPHGAVVFRRTL